MNILIAPDSFKGSLTSVEVAQALAAGWRRVRPGDTIELAPLADGGEGTLAAIEAAGGWERRTATVHDPNFHQIQADWLISPDRRSAVIEMATASGLSLVPVGERATAIHTSMGTGELLLAAIEAGVSEITLGIGGSATTDGAVGILTALGAVALGADGTPLVELPTPPVPALLGSVHAIDLTRLDPRLAGIDVRIACDVTNPLLGPAGAAATYGPQKGASPDDVAFLDDNLRAYADALEAATGHRERETAGAGAAGGTGFGMLCMRERFRTLELVAGVGVVMEAADFQGKLARADLVITGEGRIDAQTAYGKTALGVARLAHAAGVRCIAIGGGVEPAGVEALSRLGVEVVPVWERPVPVAESMAAGAAPLVECGEWLARFVRP